MSISGPDVVGQNRSAEIQLEYENRGDAVAEAQAVHHVFLSSDPSLDDADQRLEVVSHQPVGPGASIEETVTIPAFPDVPDGTYTLLVQLDATNLEAESNEENNLGASEPLDVLHLPDLVVAAARMEFSRAVVYGEERYVIRIEYVVENEGTAELGQDVLLRGYLSEDQGFNPDTDSRVRSVIVDTSELGRGGWSEHYSDVPPGDPGQYHLIVWIAADREVRKLDEENNVLHAGQAGVPP